MRNPKIGDKIRYVSPDQFWLPSHKSRAKKYLIQNKLYTVTWMKLRGSWVMVEFEECPGLRMAIDLSIYNECVKKAD